MALQNIGTFHVLLLRLTCVDPPLTSMSLLQILQTLTNTIRNNKATGKSNRRSIHILRIF